MKTISNFFPISYLLFAMCLIFTIDLGAQSGTWIWMGGSNTANSQGNYGTQGFAGVSNIPPALYQAQQWKDKQGNFWIFGGIDSGQHEYSDLWKYDPTAGTWTWVNGPGVSLVPGVYGSLGVPSPNNIPGARGWGCATWTDSIGDLWLFGGEGYDSLGNFGNLNDLWSYNIASNQWTWRAGPALSNQPGVYGSLYQASTSFVPPPRSEANCCWIDNNNNLWLFGGYGYNITSGCFNDIWRYSIAGGQWAWMGGSQLLNAPTNYGTLGVESPANVPGGRNSYSHWVDSNYLYFAGGGNFTSFYEFNDVWRFNLNTNYFTWIGGDTGNAPAGQYTHFCSTDFGDKPAGTLEERPIQLNGCSPFLFMWGGQSDSGAILNDLWSFDLHIRQWRWVNGNRSVARTGNFGVPGVSSPTNMPPGLMGPCFWSDYNGNFWLWGGQCAMGSPGNYLNTINSMWEYIPDPSCFPSDTGGTQFITASDTIICASDSVQLCAPPGFITYRWNNGDTTPCIYTSSAGNYQVVASSSLNWHAVSKAMSLTVFNMPPVSLSISGDTITSNNTGTLQWYFNDTIIPGATSSVYIAKVSGSYTLQVVDSNGCSITSNPQIITVSGITEQLPENAVAIYPNPSTGNWQVTVSRQLTRSTLEVFNAIGQLIYKAENIGTFSKISLPAVANGVYELRIASNNYRVVKKLVKE